jgi:phosphoglycolate phosphatase
LSNPLVIFDLDGTLVDTAPDLIDSLNHTITAVGLEPVSFDDVTYLVGQGVRVMIRRAFELRNAPLDETLFETLIDRFMTHYAAQMPGKSRPYPGVPECLDRLSQAGFRLAVCTNKPEDLALLLIGKLGLTDRFSAITGGDTFPVRKPDARHILGTIERAGADRSRSVMVGDSVNDILAAHNAGLASVAVSFGYSDVPVQSLKASHVVAHYDELTPDMVQRIMDDHTADAALAK